MMMEKQMRRRSAFTALLATLALVRPETSSGSATTPDQDRQMAVLPSVKKAILDATRYAEKDVELKFQTSQFFVTVINSGVNKSPPLQRETEASKIVVAIAGQIADKPDFKGVLGIHIDYVARSADGSHTDLVDGIDFRKDPAGRFVHHTT
jgi:hypothetical protein